jgi:hypothetical protein
MRMIPRDILITRHHSSSKRVKQAYSRPGRLRGVPRPQSGASIEQDLRCSMNQHTFEDVGVAPHFSSAVMLDTVEKFFSQQLEITFIESYPDRLRALLRPHDEGATREIERKVQKVGIDTFASLRAGRHSGQFASS